MSRALSIHPTSGDVYLTGSTSSTNLPGTAGGAQAIFGGGNEDAFVARLTADLKTLTQSTYLGGSDTDEGFALAVHPTSGDLYVAGETHSSNFPGTAGGAQASSGGGTSDAFVARVSADLAAVAPPTSTPTATPTSTPTNTPSNTPIAAPTNTATATPTNTPTGTPTSLPATTPTGTPVGAAAVPTLSPLPFSLLALALVTAALLLITRKGA